MAYVALAFTDPVAVEEQPSRLEIHHAEFTHEIAVATVPSSSVDSKRYRSGVPVTLAYGPTPFTAQLFVGYISHVVPDLGMQRNRKQVYMIGASFAMKQGGGLGLRDHTASGAARRVAEEFRFDKTNVQEHPRKFPTLNQSGQSYWEFLVRTAKDVGFTCYTRNTSLFFHDRLSAISRFKGAIPRAAVGSNLVSFRSQVGQSTPEGGELANRFVYGMDASTGKPILGQGKAGAQKPLLGREGLQALFSRGETGKPVASLQEANQTIEALHLANQLPITAEAVVEGNARIVVGGVLYLEGLEKTNSGLWYVTGVQHTFDNKSYRTTARLGRDALTASTSLPAAPAVDLPPVRSSRLLNGQWVVT
jgi:hypothetical protein